mmetsp:Transcript_8988/g.17953  ORF Transcript_8988/g.17953 Transcript_8988/m.17953 type:complete len:85 (+) Transcript_8988:140-394(+)
MALLRKSARCCGRCIWRLASCVCTSIGLFIIVMALSGAASALPERLRVRVVGSYLFLSLSWLALELLGADVCGRLRLTWKRKPE